MDTTGRLLPKLEMFEALASAFEGCDAAPGTVFPVLMREAGNIISSTALALLVAKGLLFLATKLPDDQHQGVLDRANDVLNAVTADQMLRDKALDAYHKVRA